jgi:flagellar protein FliS
MRDQRQIAREYKKKQIESASPGQLIVMLYDGAIDHLNKALLAMEETGPHRIEKFHNHLITAQNIITELTVALDVEKGGDIAKNLFRLYEFMNTRLVEANVKKNIGNIEEVKDLLVTLRAAWHEVQHVPINQDADRRLATGGLNIQG